MAYKVILPKLGADIKKATIIEWRKQEGDSVSRDDVLLEVETYKAVFEVEAEYNGILRKILYPAGVEVPTTKAVAIIAGPDEDISSLEARINEEAEPTGQTFARQVKEDWLISNSQEPGALSAGIKMSPAARRLVKEKEIDAHSLARHFQGKKEVLEQQDIKDFVGLEKVVIYGAGTGARQVLEIIHKAGKIEVIGFIDDNPELKKKLIYGYRVLGGFDFLPAAFERKQFSSVVISFHSEIRRKIFIKLKQELPQIRIKTLIDPRAVVSHNVEIGEGVFIEAGAVIGPGVKIGDNVIIDIGVNLCHDCHIGAHSHLAPGCIISGVTCLKENVLVGLGASINTTVTIGKNAIVNPGSAVMNDVEENVVVSGVPAAIIGKSRRGEQ